MINSVIYIFGYSIPLYGVLFYVGIAVAAIVAVILHRRAEIEIFDIAGSAVYAMIGAIAGAKLLFLAISARQLIEQHIPIEAAIKGGFVFYGGLLGGALGLMIYTKQFRMDFRRFADLYTTVLPLGHAFGRVGCFFAGCCYGIEWEHGYIYSNTVGSTPIGIPLLPIQLIEAGLLVLLFAVQLILYIYRSHAGRNTILYLIVYPILRFILEFFRGDTERGKFLWFSTSQWVSLMILAVICIMFAVKKYKKKKAEI